MKLLQKRLEKRIEQIKIERDTMTGHNSRTKYNYSIGELQWMIQEIGKYKRRTAKRNKQ